MQKDSSGSRAGEIFNEMATQAASKWGPEEAEALGSQMAETAEWISLVEKLHLDIWADEPDYVGFPPRPARMLHDGTQ